MCPAEWQAGWVVGVKCCSHPSHAAPTPLAQLPRAVPSSSKEPILYVYIISNISLPLMPILMPASGTRLLHIALAVVKGQSGEGPLEVTGGHGTVAIAHYY